MSSHPHHHAQASMINTLQTLLADMETVVSTQESIVIEEREAMKVFDGERLAELVECRARSQSEFDELESRCKRLSQICNGENKLAHVIEQYAPDLADDLQSTRIDLVRRMQCLANDHAENHVRLRAAWNVTTSILQQVGVIEIKHTYQNTHATQQATS